MKPIQFEGCNQYLVSEEGVVVNNNTGRVLKTDLTNAGYKRVTLWSTEQKPVRIAVHRLVAIHYCDNPERKPMVNHKDGNKLNNHYSNLEWVSCKENTAHAFKTGLRKGPNRMPKDVALGVLKDKKDGLLSRREICDKWGISIHQYTDMSRYYQDLQ